MNNSIRKTIAIILVVVTCAVTNSALAAQITKLTDITNGEAFFPSVNANGKVVFSSNSNLTNENPDGSDELFVIDKNGMGLKQITNFQSNDTVGFFRIAGRANIITFSSSTNQFGANPDKNLETFTIKNDGTELRQITITQNPVQNTFVGINPTGEVTSFQCTTQNPSNIGGEAEKICVANFNGSSVKKLTEPESFQFASPTITSAPFVNITSFLGTHLVAFSTTKLNLIPRKDEVEGGASFEIFTAEVDQNLNPIKFHQLTSTPKGELLHKFTPRISEDGSTVAFVNSTNRQNPDMTFTPVTRIGVINTDGSNLTKLYQNFEECGDPTISGDGRKIVFNCKANFTGENPDGNNEIFVASRDGSMIEQITETTSGENLFPFIDPSGKFVVWESTSNINAQNPNGARQIYLQADLETIERPSPSDKKPKISLPPGFSFIDTRVGQITNADFDIANTGEEDLVVSVIKDDPNIPTIMTGQVSNLPFTLQKGQSAKVIVTFAPTAVGMIMSTVTIESNDPDKPTAKVEVFGNGTQPELIGSINKAVEKRVRAEEGEKFVINFKAIVKNFGSANSGPFLVSFYLSEDKFLDEGDELLKEVPAANLPPKKGSLLKEKVERTESTRGKFLLIQVDSLGQVQEVNEENNISFKRIK